MSFSEKKTASVSWKFYPPSNEHLSSDSFGSAKTKFHLEVCKSTSPNVLHFTLHLDTNTAMKISFEASYWYTYGSQERTLQIKGDVSHDKSFSFFASILRSNTFFEFKYFLMTFEVTGQRIPKFKPPIDHSQALHDQLSALRLDASSADITLISTLDGREFPAHKLILSLRSPVFAAMFTHDDLKENQMKKVEIDYISGEVMEALLKYIYSGDVQGISGIVGDLLTAADKYDIPLLVEECLRSMSNNVSISNAAYFFYLAHLHQLEELKTDIGIFIAQYKAAVRLSAGYKEFIKPDRHLVELFMNGSYLIEQYF